MLGHLGAMLSRLGVMLGDLWAMLGLGWAILGPCWAILGLCSAIFGAMLDLCRAILELILGHLGAMLAQGGTPPNVFFRFMLFFSKSKKHRKLRGFSGAEHRSAVAGGSRIAKATAFDRGLCRSTGPAGPDLSAYARQPARGPC